MARITYIVGNGLDLSLDMNTSYRDFYEHMKMSKPRAENRIFKAIQESPENWGDFELSLGEYTHYLEKFPEKNLKTESIKLHEELEEIRDDLANYLAAEQKKAEDKINNTILTSNGYYIDLPSGQRSLIDRANANGGTTFQFITLNYTRTLEEILVNSSDRLLSRSIKLLKPHHIHGDLDEDMTLGVSDESQLSSSMTGAERDDLIKPNLIYSTNDGRMDTLTNMIKSSTTIVMYGTSIGETDKYIWRIVNDWLVENEKNHVIIHAHNSAYTTSVKRSSRMKNQFISNVQERLLRFSGQDGDTMAEMKSRVFVVHNTDNLFD